MAIRALHTAATGMQAMATKIDVIANNIANADTTGYKSSRANFQDLIYQLQAQPGVQTSANTSAPLGTQVGLGVTVSNTQILFKQGAANLTGNPLDIMIQGDGFFQIELPGGGTAYTRAGNFVRNLDGELVLGHSNGYRLLNTPQIPQDVPSDAVSVSADGRVSVRQADGTLSELGQLQLARFANPAGLLQNGANLFFQSPASGEAQVAEPGVQGNGTMLQGTLEQSTTDAVTELVELIKTQRFFQMNSQSIQTADEALQVVASLRR
ncbi:MAG: flagellar basal-body rod protein FlgG [Phycisphaerae bacterium]